LALTPGTRLGVYEITASIGEGGMGQVYRATDTALGRQVAIKILPEAFASDPERLARFEREAKTLASLNHPHIAAIYAIEKSTGQHALVMELVEGEDLSQRIAKGSIPFDEALPIAKQIAEALEAAHEQGIIHRDLKPANIKVRSDGTVKVLDFGLAKAMEPAAGSSPSMSMSPTLSLQATQAGMILGTAGYMSPEQARGRTVDKRADIWAFGAVLFEMLTGKRAFPGEDITDTLAAVVRSEPDWSLVPGNLSPMLLVFLRRSLQKDPKQRIPDIAAMRLALEGAFETPAPSPTASPAPAAPQPTRKWAIPALVAAIVAAVLTSVAWWYARPSPPPSTIARFSLVLPPDQNFSNTGRQFLAVSPDGTQVAYTANLRLYVRSMSDLDARPIGGIDGSYAVTNPVFSPDGRSIAFLSGADNTLKKIAVTGGAAVTLCPADNPFGMSWGPDGILFGQGGKGILRVSAAGGKPEAIVSVKGGEFAYGPQMLPDGQTVLFTLSTNTSDWDNGARIVVQSLKSGERKTVVEGGSDARYLPTGHIVYAVGGVLFAVPFDVRRLQVSGGPVPILEGVMRAGSGQTAVAQFSTGANGSLVFVSGPASPSAGRVAQITLMDRKGTVEPLKLQPGAYDHPRVSPDGTRIAFATDDGKDAVVWVYELSGATAMRRLTFGGKNRFPIWSTDGQHVVFQSDREGDLGIFWQAADGSGTPERLTKADKDTSHIPESWSPKGDGFLFRVTKGTDISLWLFSLKDRTARPFGAVRSQTPTDAAFSPDGRWVTYSTSMTTDAGQRVVYVQPVPATGATYQIPVLEAGGYRHPQWSPDGKELFYFLGGTRMRTVTVTVQPTLAFGNPTLIPNPSFWGDNAGDVARRYDVMPDGQKFVGIIAAGAGGSTVAGAPTTSQIQVVLNWFEELKVRVPTK
jgi:serine/threonine protein kinase